MTWALSWYNLISHTEVADICCLPEGKYSQDSILQFFSQPAEVTATTSMKFCGVWISTRRIQTVWFFMHPAAKEINTR